VCNALSLSFTTGFISELLGVKTMAEVKMTPTVVSESEAERAITAGLPMLGPGALLRDLAELIMANVWLETGRGKSLMNHNWGNITAGKSWTGDFWRPPWFNKAEVDALPPGTKKDNLLNLHARMLKNEVPSKFRAYPSAQAGLNDYLARLGKEFIRMTEAGKTGDALKFAQAIRDTKYNPDAEPVSLSRTLTQLVNEFRSRNLFASLPKAPAASVLPSSSAESPVLSSGGHSVSNPVQLPVLRAGNHGPAVELFRNMTVGGTGKLIAKEVKTWQLLNGLKDDGVIGPISWNRILSSIQRP
jgi:hypothetical protein